MKIFKTIWKKIRGLFTKRPPSTEKIISEEKAVLAEIMLINEIYTKIKESTDANEKANLIKKIAKHNTAKTIIDFVENETELTIVKKKGRKKLFELHELRTELQILGEQRAILDFNESQIKQANYPDTSSFDKRINGLFTQLGKNNIEDKVKLTDISISTFDKSFQQLERLLTDKSTLKKHKNREKEKQRYEELYKNQIKQKLSAFETYINQNKLDEAKLLLNVLTKSLKPDYEKEISRFSRAKDKLKEKEIQIFKKQQEELLKRQAEEARKIKEIQEKKFEEQRIATELQLAMQKLEEDKRTEKERKLKVLLTKKFNWRDFQKVLQENNITAFYHFTDQSNLKSIKANGGLYSWFYCDMNNIVIPMPGGSMGSRQNDKINGKRDFVRLAFNKEHPMLFIAEKDGRISNSVWLNIDIEVAYFENTEFSDKNAAAYSSYKPIIGKEVSNLENVRFDILKKAQRVKHYNLNDDEKPYNQAEVLVKTWIPLEHITNINNIA